MKSLTRWIPIIMLITLAARINAYPVPYESWMGAYFSDTKIGYLTYNVDKSDVDGKPGYRIASIMNNHLTVLGADLTQVVTTIVYTDDKYNPLTEEFEMTSGGKTTKVTAEFKKKTVDCVLITGDEKSTKTVSIPAGANLVGDAMFAITDAVPEVGKEYQMYYFNPLMLSVDPLKIKVERKEKLKIDGKDIDTIVMLNTSPMGEMTVWQDYSGDAVQVKAMAGITMVRESKEKATSGISGSTQDFAVLTSVKTETNIAHPRDVKSLDIIFKGIDDKSMLISDSRQKISSVDGDKEAAHFNITAKKFNSAKSVKLPMDNISFHDYLVSTPYIDYDVGSITEEARQIIGGETNAYTACTRLRDWIYKNMHTRADIGITRSASDVLKSKEGVCRDYAILFAALARSAGIPSRLAAGLLFVNDAFYYHAWVECYVGEWVPFDATLPTDFVDATHIKLAQGSPTAMFSLARVIGNLKAEVKAYK